MILKNTREHKINGCIKTLDYFLSPRSKNCRNPILFDPYVIAKGDQCGLMEAGNHISCICKDNFFRFLASATIFFAEIRAETTAMPLIPNPSKRGIVFLFMPPMTTIGSLTAALILSREMFRSAFSGIPGSYRSYSDP